MIECAKLDRLSDAWERFQQTGEIDESVVRLPVARSWERCRALGIDPHAPIAVVREPGALARVGRSSTQCDFLDEAVPFLDFLKNAIRNTKFLLVITDSLGVVLRVLGDPEMMEIAALNNYVSGVSRAESDVGTNAICLALQELEPIQLSGAEHWSVRHHRWTCASAPVISPSGDVLGTITLSGESTNTHGHTLGMVISAAEAISDRLKGKAADHSRQKLDGMLSSLLGAVSDAIVTVDQSGDVSHINEAAVRLLGTGRYEAVGQSLLKLFSGAPELRGLLDPNKDAAGYEILLDGSGGRVHLAVTPYRLTRDDQIEGAILVLRERREFLNEVREVSGFSAVFTFDDIIGNSPLLVRQIGLARIVAHQSSRVLITGETGTGKELVAQAIHNASPRSAGPFVAVNCAAIPRDLLESELFGYKGGAFTGSRKTGQVGKLELADGGTIFLDEINQMPLDLQSKLLRVLQDSTITRLGDSRPIRVDARVITATNEDLYEKSRRGEFRQDLYFRLSVVELSLPPLRERLEDVQCLSAVLLTKIAHRLDRAEKQLSPEAVAHLSKHRWPGNIRELENVLEMASIICEGDLIEPRHLIYRTRHADERRTEPVNNNRQYSGLDASPPVRDVELEMIRAAMREMRGNVVEAARKLGLSRSTIYRRMKEHHIIKSITVE